MRQYMKQYTIVYETVYCILYYIPPTGSLVPFSLRLLHAQLPIHTGSPQLALDRLCTLQVVCDQVRPSEL